LLLRSVLECPRPYSFQDSSSSIRVLHGQNTNEPREIYIIPGTQATGFFTPVFFNKVDFISNTGVFSG